MSKVRVHISVSVDGYVAGPNQTQENPLGEGGEQLHDWAIALKAWREPHGREGGEENASNRVMAEENANVGAEIMGRGKFGPARRGPWGDDPPFRKPVFVVTHHEREPLRLSDTTFTFVTNGIESALAQARDAAGDQDVVIGGGADVINQYLAAWTRRRDRAPRRPDPVGGRRAAVRRRRSRPQARTGPRRRGTRGDAPQVPRREVSRGQSPYACQRGRLLPTGERW